MGVDAFDVFELLDSLESALRLPRLTGVEPLGVFEPEEGWSATSRAPPIGVDALDVFEPAVVRVGDAASDGGVRTSHPEAADRVTQPVTVIASGAPATTIPVTHHAATVTTARPSIARPVIAPPVMRHDTSNVH